MREHGVSFTAAILLGYGVTSLGISVNSFVFRSIYDSLDATPRPWNWDTLLRLGELKVAHTSLTILSFFAVWIITRAHRAHQRAVVVAFVIVLASQHIPAIAQLLIEGFSSSRLPPALSPQIISTGIQTVITLAAGLWVIRKERFSEMHPRTQAVCIVTAVLIVVSALHYEAWRVGIVGYPAAERYPMDALEIASSMYLVVLLWRRRSPLSSSTVAVA